MFLEEWLCRCLSIKGPRSARPRQSMDPGSLRASPGLVDTPVPSAQRPATGRDALPTARHPVSAAAPASAPITLAYGLTALTLCHVRERPSTVGFQAARLLCGAALLLAAA